MQIHTLQLKNRRKAKKTIGRGGKKGTYCGKGMKGQKARSGAKVNPLFEGGRSTLIDHMKKKKGFKSKNLKKAIIHLSDLVKIAKDKEKIDKDFLIKAGLVDKIEAKNGIKILGSVSSKKKLIIQKGIDASSQTKGAIKKAGGEIVA